MPDSQPLSDHCTCDHELLTSALRMIAQGYQYLYPDYDLRKTLTREDMQALAQAALDPNAASTDA